MRRTLCIKPSSARDNADTSVQAGTKPAVPSMPRAATLISQRVHTTAFQRKVLLESVESRSEINLTHLILRFSISAVAFILRPVF